MHRLINVFSPTRLAVYFILELAVRAFVMLCYDVICNEARCTEEENVREKARETLGQEKWRERDELMEEEEGRKT